MIPNFINSISMTVHSLTLRGYSSVVDGIKTQLLFFTDWKTGTVKIIAIFLGSSHMASNVPITPSHHYCTVDSQAGE